MDKDTFLYQALEDIDGFDGVLLPQDFYDFIVGRDGSCLYSVDEIETWLTEVEDSDKITLSINGKEIPLTSEQAEQFLEELNKALTKGE